MIKPLFVLRTYNDIDHILPVIWKFLQEGSKPKIIFNSSYDYHSDPRIIFLQKYHDVSIVRMVDKVYEQRIIHLGSSKKFGPFNWFKSKIYNQIRKPDLLVGKIYRKLFFDCTNIYSFFKNENINLVIFEWGNPEMKGEVFEKILTVAKGLGIPVCSLPHGLNIYLNSDIHETYIKKIKKGILPNFRPWNKYDKIVVQSDFHADHMKRFGIEASKVLIWGSTRFSPEWLKINYEIYQKFESKENSQDKIKIVFMLPHWIYNVNKEDTITLVNGISKIKNVHLVIKDHTRGDTGEFPKKEKNLLEKMNNVEFETKSSSTSLIKWCDMIINFGSSIGLEAIYQEKHIIYPMYLHSNKTIHDVTNTTHLAKSSEDVYNYINRFSSNQLTQIPKDEIKLLLKKVVYGSKEPHDVLDFYYQSLKKIAQRI